VKYNKLYASILKSEWAMMPDAWNSYSIFLKKLADGTIEDLNALEVAKPELVISYFDTKGSRYRHDYNNPDNIPKDAVAVVEIIGVFTKYGNLCSYGMTELGAILNSALANPKITGVVLLVDSGGGAANAIAPLSSVLANREKPVVALGDTVGSAAYWVASQCDYILAENTISSAFGSIGTMISFADIQPKLEKEGIKFHTIYAPESTHKNQAFELAREGKYEMIQREMLSPMAKAFQDHVKQNRGSKLKLDEPGLLNGKMFFAKDALEVGLIDGIGNMPSAIEKVRSLASNYKLKKALSNV